MMSIIVNGVATPVPGFTVFEATLNPLQRTAERNTNGRLMRETLPDKWTLRVEWVFNNPNEYYAWFKYLKGLTRIDFTVNFPAPTGNMEQAVFYISPITAEMLNLSRGATGWWNNLKCNFIEV